MTGLPIDPAVLGGALAGALGSWAFGAWRGRRMRRQTRSTTAVAAGPASDPTGSTTAVAEDAFAVLLDNSVDLICVVDHEGRFVRVSRSWGGALGVAAEELIGRRFLDFVHPDDVAATLQEAERQQGGAEVMQFRNRYRRADGTWRVLEWNSRPRGEHIYAVARDVTDAEAREAEIRSLRDRMGLFIEYTPAAVAMFDADMRYLVASRGWYEQYGLEQVDILGRSHYEVFPTVPERWKELHRRCLAGETLSADRDGFEREDGSTVWVRWRLEPWRAEDGTVGGLVMFTTVITDEVEREELLDDARERAERANRAKSDFLANMSHEIRTPMAAILGYADLIDLDDPERTADAVRTIRLHGEHLLTVINDILDVSKIEAGRMEVESVETRPLQILDETLAMLRPRARAKGLELRVEFGTQVPETVVSDPTRLRQVLINLVGNAVKFTETGAVTVRLGYGTALGEGATGATLSLRVEDTGIGMTAEESARVMQFRAFTQADDSMSRRFGGTGLGLRISSELCRMLGGRLVVTSEKGAGSVFEARVQAPTVQGTRTLEPAQSAELVSYRRLRREAREKATVTLEGLRVLVVDDGPDNRRLVRFHLEKAGAVVECARDGREALLRACDRGAAPLDLVLMDMQMPVLDGYDATRRLRETGDDVPVVALTAHAMQGDRERCLEAGCDDYLTKPVRRTELLQMVLRRARRVAH